MLVEDRVHVLASDHSEEVEVVIRSVFFYSVEKRYVSRLKPTYRMTMKTAGIDKGIASRPMVGSIMIVSDLFEEEVPDRLD